MSGHSKWATIKHKKAATDQKRAKVFAKLIRQVEVAAREGGGDLDANPTLRTMFQKARDNSIPLDTIERAVKRGTGDLDGVVYEQITYEGYGPNGVAVLIECLTDNRNRAASDVRVAMTRNGGSMADPGSVSYLFNRKGVVIVPKGELSEDDVLGAVLDAGAEARHQGAVGQREHAVDDLLGRLALEGGPVVRAVLHADARVQEAQVVVDLGDGADGGPRVAAGRLLVDGDRRGQPLDEVHVGRIDPPEELSGVGAERLGVAALALGEDRVEGEGRLAGPGQPREDDELVPREVEVDATEVVLPGAADDQAIRHTSGGA